MFVIWQEGRHFIPAARQQYGAAKIQSPFWEYNAILHFLGFFISLTLLAAGLETMRRASNTPSDDFWEI